MSRPFKMAGDLSDADKMVLNQLVQGHGLVLEHGCGLSTAVMMEALWGRQCSFHLVETSPEYRTAFTQRLPALLHRQRYFFYDRIPDQIFTFCFVDGPKDERPEFMVRAFDKLTDGGVMAIHDTRKEEFLDPVLAMVSQFWDQVLSVEFNYMNSNITVVRKRSVLPYYDWNYALQRKDPAEWGRL